jgi:hypothetical protein
VSPTFFTGATRFARKSTALAIALFTSATRFARKSTALAIALNFVP